MNSLKKSLKNLVWCGRYDTS